VTDRSFRIDARIYPVDSWFVGNKRETILLVFISLLAILTIGVFFALWNPTPPPVVTMPVPNGYTLLAQAGTIVDNQSGAFEQMDVTELRSLVDANTNALQTARSGLAEKSRVPLEFSRRYASQHMHELQQMRMLAYAFFAEGRLAELEKRTNDAAVAYLDAGRLGIDSRRGGPLIDNLVGINNEWMGTSRLQKLVPDLDAKTSAALARQLEAVDEERESWEQILQNEKYWVRNMYPGLQYRVAALFRWKATKAENAKMQQKFKAQQNRMCRLMLDLAAHAYQLDKGHRPTNVTELVPAYLKAAPVDPLTGKQMTLSP
jgi:hypothetical protein